MSDPLTDAVQVERLDYRGRRVIKEREFNYRGMKVKEILLLVQERDVEKSIPAKYTLAWIRESEMIPEFEGKPNPFSHISLYSLMDRAVGHARLQVEEAFCEYWGLDQGTTQGGIVIP